LILQDDLGDLLKETSANPEQTQHVISVTKKYEYICNICCKISNFWGIQNTQQDTHTGEKPYQCNMKFSLNGSQQTHLNIPNNTSEKYLKSHVCDIKFSVNGNLKSHMKTQTGEKLSNIIFV